MSAKTRKTTRKIKQNSLSQYDRNPKFTDSFGINDFHLTTSQNELVSKIENHDITFVEAPAGTGKTLAALHYAVKNHLTNRDDIIIIRTPVEAGGDKVGFLPSGLEDKLEPHFASSRLLLNKLLTQGKVDTELEKTIFFKVPNFCLGCTFSNATVIVDEAQEIPPLILKLLLERIGEHAKMIIIGDRSQLYSNSKSGRNGLTSAMKRFFETDVNRDLVRDDEGNLIPKYKNQVAYHTFGIDEVLRSEIVKTVLAAYQKNPL